MYVLHYHAVPRSSLGNFFHVSVLKLNTCLAIYKVIMGDNLFEIGIFTISFLLLDCCFKDDIFVGE